MAFPDVSIDQVKEDEGAFKGDASGNCGFEAQLSEYADYQGYFQAGTDKIE